MGIKFCILILHKMKILALFLDYLYCSVPGYIGIKEILPSLDF